MGFLIRVGPCFLIRMGPCLGGGAGGGEGALARGPLRRIDPRCFSASLSACSLANCARIAARHFTRVQLGLTQGSEVSGQMKLRGVVTTIALNGWTFGRLAPYRKSASRRRRPISEFSVSISAQTILALSRRSRPLVDDYFDLFANYVFAKALGPKDFIDLIRDGS